MVVDFLTANVLIQLTAVLTVGFIVTALLIPATKKIATLLGAIDLPDARRVHRIPTPRAGGLAVFLGMQAAAITAYLVFSPSSFATTTLDWWINFSVASSVIIGIGLIDDIRGLKPLSKLSGQAIASLTMYCLGLRLSEVCGIDLPPGIDIIATLFWYILVINAFNLIDGIDGLASGLAAIGALGIFGTFVHRDMLGEGAIILGFIGACAGFLRSNRHPASIFLGDTGSNFIGFFLATLMLSTGSKGFSLPHFWIPFFMVCVPALDVFLAYWRRGMRRVAAFMGKSTSNSRIMHADTEHLHHRLLKLGYSQLNVSAILYLFNAVIVLACLLTLQRRDLAFDITIFTGIVAMAALYCLVPLKEVKESLGFLYISVIRPRRPIFALFTYLSLDLLAISAALYFSILLALPGMSTAYQFQVWRECSPLWVGLPLATLIFLQSSQKLTTSKDLRHLGNIMCVVLVGIIVCLDSFRLLNQRSFATVSAQYLSYSGFLVLLTATWRVLLQMVEKFVSKNREELARYLTIPEGAKETTIIFLPDEPSGFDFNFLNRLWEGSNLERAVPEKSGTRQEEESSSPNWLQ